MMTIKEAHGRITEAFPASSNCIHLDSWRHHRENGAFGSDHDYRISVLPGVNGEACSQWRGKSLAEAVAAMLAPAAHQPATPEDVQQHASEIESELEEARRNPEGGAPRCS